MCYPENYSEKDELRAQFTRWLEVVVQNALKDYLRKLRRNNIPTVSLDQVDETQFGPEPDMLRGITDSADSFSFEEERLSRAFRELPLMRRHILEMLFVQELQPVEIAARLQCSVQHVYNQRSLALKRLRVLMDKDGEDE